MTVAERLENSAKTFSIDYDGTWSADPDAFAAFAGMLRQRGHRVLVITARVSGHAEVMRECGTFVDAVLFSGPDYKRDHAAAQGETVDIWIDDNPGMIGPDIPLVDPWSSARNAAARDSVSTPMPSTMFSKLFADFTSFALPGVWADDNPPRKELIWGSDQSGQLSVMIAISETLNVPLRIAGHHTSKSVPLPVGAYMLSKHAIALVRDNFGCTNVAVILDAPVHLTHPALESTEPTFLEGISRVVPMGIDSPYGPDKTEWAVVVESLDHMVSLLRAVKSATEGESP